MLGASSRGLQLHKYLHFLIYIFLSLNVHAGLSKDGMTPLMIAIAEGEQRDAMALIESGVPLDIQDDSGRTALMTSIKWSDEKITNAILDRHANIHLVDTRGWNALHYSIRHSETRTRRRLLASGADINWLTKKNESPVIFAATGYDDIALRELASRGAKLDVRNDLGKTAIMISDELKDDWSVNVLLSFGAIPYIADENGLHWEIALKPDRIEIFIGFLDGENHNHLMIALLSKNFMASSKFINLPFNHDHQDLNGKTALMMMVENNLIDQVKEIIMRNRANLNLRDNENRTALAYAREFGFSEIAQLLLEAGAIN